MNSPLRYLLLLLIAATMASHVAAQTVDDSYSDDPTDEYPTDEYPTDEDPTDEYPTDEYPTDEDPTDEYPTDEECYDYDYILENARDFGLYNEDDVFAYAMEELDLYTEEDLEDARAAGRQDVIDNPEEYGLYTKAQYRANFAKGRAKGRAAGRAEVLENPDDYELLDLADVPVLRVAAAPGTPLAFSLPDGWKRMAQSGMPKKGWKLKKGVLSGVVPTKRMLSIRLTPYKNGRQGAQVTLQIQPSAK